jgi:hypothetical protein
MALTKEKVIDKIEIFRNGVVQVRETIEIYENGELLGSKYFRYIYNPLTPLAEISNLRVRAICNFIWTDAVKAAYAAEVAASHPNGAV